MRTVIQKRIAAISGYFAFVTTLMLAVIVVSQTVSNSSAIIGLLATSLPALAAWLYVEAIDWEGLEQARRIVRGVVSTSALTLSLAGFVLMLWNFSRLAVFLTVLQIGMWYLVISGVFYLSEEQA